MEEGQEEKPLTREDVLRLIEEHGGKTKGLDLSNKEFEGGIDLRGIDLFGIILERATLERAHLERATLAGVNLEGATLFGAHLERANLLFAHLEGANLLQAHLEGAYLLGAHLEGADLSYAHLEGARLMWVKFSPDTMFEDTDWGSKYILGEEVDKYFGQATDVYRKLKQWHTNAGMYDVAGDFFFREMEARRKATGKDIRQAFNDAHALRKALVPFKEIRPVRYWLWHALLYLLCGYGERPTRILIWAIGLIFVLAAFYTWLGSFSSGSFWDCLYYSAVSFTALGYGSWAPQPTGWAKGMGAAEAVIGVFMMALFLVTFVRKMVR
jgi:hypothetical protein